MPTPRIFQKLSIVFVATAEKTQVFHSIEEMPEDLRKRLVRHSRTSQMDTILIANDKGREMLQEQGWPFPDAAPEAASFTLTPLWRWIVVCLLGGCLGLLLTLLIAGR